ncbi:aminoglycoside phosphotransferase family protein [Streptomyces buecherae]|uniref:aminoglycoside phosphotransferase family protein n=1 Tax=Streptomyces buecherae TaxID=2763006 RepID=UPI001C26B179|nr:aminoglycoside phosphotransferase family protein [Streptomyces buecherae]
MIEVPEQFRRATIEREGAAGAAWVEQLPALTDQLLDRWGCEPDGDVGHGAVGIVVPVVRRRDAAPAVVKVSFPHPGNVHEPDAFAVWGGRGAVLLHERDDEHFAMLLERARPETLAGVADGDEVAATAGQLSRRLAVPAPVGLPRLRDRVAEWGPELRADAAELPHGMSPRVLDAAAATIRELGPDQPGTLVHGDLHARNILRADREPWLAIDPKGYVGDPAYDSGALLTSCAVPLVESGGDLDRGLRRAVEVFAEAAGLDRVRVLRWAQLHAVRAAFWGRRHGFTVARSGPERDQVVHLAEHVAELFTDGT